MNLHFIDSTLREGLQSPGGMAFPDEVSKLAYINDMSGLGVMDRFEVYMPGPHIDDQTWRQITSSHRDKIQIYVGAADTFDISEREDLLGAAWTMLSTTLVSKSRANLTRLSRISECTHNSPLRVGIECAGELEPGRVLELTQMLGQTAGVAVVNVNDSNDGMKIGWIDGLLAELAEQNVSELPRMGFHFHNGKVGASVKARSLITGLRELGLSDIELDVTAFGLGDRQGVLAMTEAMHLLPVVEDELIGRHETVAGKLVIRSATDRLADPDSAASHYDKYGRLRPEYQHM